MKVVLKFAEGSVVSYMSKIKVEEPVKKDGTIWLVLQGRYIVLDKDGYLHDCQAHEIYEVQE